MKKLVIVLILFSTLLFQGCSAFSKNANDIYIEIFTDYTLFGETLDQKDACGEGGCVPVEKDRAKHFNNDVGSIQVGDGEVSVKTIALQYIGELITIDDTDDDRCGVKGSFIPNDVVFVKAGDGGYSVDRTVTGTFEINASAVTDSTVNDILEVAAAKDINVDNIANLKADLKLIYNNLDKIDYELSATTYFLALSDEVRFDIRDRVHHSRLDACVDEMERKKDTHRLIDAITLVEYSLRDDSNVIETKVAEIKALFSTYGINFDINPFVKSNLTKTVNRSVNSAYAVLVMERSYLSRYLDN